MPFLVSLWSLAYDMFILGSAPIIFFITVLLHVFCVLPSHQVPFHTHYSLIRLCTTCICILYISIFFHTTLTR